jgi:PAS domain S-box-containing protein
MGQENRHSAEIIEFFEGAPVGFLILGRDGSIRHVNRAGAEMLGEDVSALADRRLSLFVSEDARRSFDGFLEKVFESKKREQCEAAIERGDRDSLVVRIEAVASAGGNDCLAVMIDLTEEKKSQEAREQNQTRLEALEKLRRMTGASIGELCNFALEQAVLVTQSDVGHFFFYDEDLGQLMLFSRTAETMRQCTIQNKPTSYNIQDMGLAGEAIRRRRTIITNDYSADGPGCKGYPEGHIPIKRHINVPIFSADRIVALVGVGNKATPYDESDREQLETLLQGVWLVVERRQEEDLRRESDERYRKLLE